MSSDWTTENGHHFHKCTVTGCDHTEDDATCGGGTATCTKKAVCEVCDKEYGELGDHNFGAWIQTVAPGCETEGSEYRECGACDHVETRVIEALGHNLGDLIEVTKAVHTDKVQTPAVLLPHYHCEICDTYFNEDGDKTTNGYDTYYGPTPEHEYTMKKINDNTHGMVCECGKIEDGSQVAHTVGTAATCRTQAAFLIIRLKLLTVSRSPLFLRLKLINKAASGFFSFLAVIYALIGSSVAGVSIIKSSLLSLPLPCIYKTVCPAICCISFIFALCASMVRSPERNSKLNKA